LPIEENLMAQEDISKLRLDKTERKKYGRRSKKWIYRGAYLLAAVIVLYMVMKAAGVEEVRAGTVSLTYPSQAITALNVSGYVVAERKAALASKTTGRLVWLGVEEGSRVEKGQVVARLENEDLSAALAQTKAGLKASQENLLATRAELDDARADFNRKKTLLDKGFITRSAFDQAEARLKKAEAGVEAARAQVNAGRAAARGAEASLGYTFIRAPFSGVVLTKNADIGDILSPLGAAANAKAAVVTIADLDTLQVEVDVAESNISKVAKSMPAEIQLDAFPDKRFPGKVHMIVPTADRTKASVLVKVRFEEKAQGILPDMSAKVAFLTRELAAGEDAPVTTVPATAVVTDNEGSHVFLIQGDRAERAPVKAGKKLGDSVEVEGLKEGQTIVLDPPEGLQDGRKVKVLEE
jgi:RND family efflux transporter MFP subunit